MAEKEDKAFAATLDLDKELPVRSPSDDDFVLPLFILTIIYGIMFSISAVLLNAIPPQLWAPSLILTQVVAYFTLRLEDYIDVALFTSHPLDLPIIIYSLPALIYLSMIIFVFWLFKPWKGTMRKPTTSSYVPALGVFISLGMGALVGLSFWEEVLVTLPLTMSLFVLPWYFALYRKRLLGADFDSSKMESTG